MFYAYCIREKQVVMASQCRNEIICKKLYVNVKIILSLKNINQTVET